MNENKLYLVRKDVLGKIESLRPVRSFYDSYEEYKAAMSIFNEIKNAVGHLHIVRDKPQILIQHDDHPVSGLLDD